MVAQLHFSFRGHPIWYDKGSDTWFYCDTDKPVPDSWKDRGCGYCGKPSTPEGHDGCLGELEGVTNACCGHGCTEDAYVQFLDGTELREEQAIQYFEEEDGRMGQRIG